MDLGISWEGQLGHGGPEQDGSFSTAVMRFMGDAPLKGQNELDVLCTLLKVSPEACISCFLLALGLGFPICSGSAVGNLSHCPESCECILLEHSQLKSPIPGM